jgi:uncharacterized protein (TIGR03067 family)
MILPVLSVFCLLFPVQPDPQSDALKEELKRLQGTWQIELQDEDGKKLADDDLKGRTITFGKTLFLVRHQQAMVQIGKLKIDPARDPKTINAVIEKGTHEGDILPGIYSLDGDTLKICLSTDGDSRPKEIKAGPKLLLLVCKRVPVKADEGDLSGNYQAVSIDITGKKISYEAAFERVGDAYLVLYTVKGKVVYFGTGIRQGNVFAMCWMSAGQAGISLYQIEKGNRLVGQFTELGGPGFFGTETLTRLLKDL